MIKTLPTLVRTRQCFDLHFLLIRLKIDLRMWFFRRAALGRTNLLFRPTREKIEVRGCEFPSVHPNWVGKEHRYLYMSVCQNPTENGPLQAVIKLDKKSGEKQLWSASPKGFPGEPVFVPYPYGTKEDDGWIISLVYDAGIHRSYLIILDAKDLNRVTRVLPF